MRRTERGFSLMEITVVLAIVSVVLILVYSLMEKTMQTTMFNESHNDLSLLSQHAVNTLQTEIVQTRVAFEEDAVGVAYRAAMPVPAGITVWPDSYLPVFDPAGALEPDTAARRATGNSLLLARQLAPLPITYDHDSDSSTPEVEFLADRYRFEYAYLSPRTLKSFSGSGFTLDLLMSTSREYADEFQIAAMGPATGKIAAKLIAAGLTTAWNPGQPVNSAFYSLAGALDNTFDPPLARPTIAVDQTRSLLRSLLGGRVSGRMDYSVAFVPPSPAPPFPIPTPIPVYAAPVAGRPGFPSGFEVKVVGAARNRQVVTRVVVMSNYLAGHYESQQAFVVTAARF